MSKGRKRREAEERRNARYVVIAIDLMEFGAEAQPVTEPLPLDAAEAEQARLQEADVGLTSYELRRLPSDGSASAPDTP